MDSGKCMPNSHLELRQNLSWFAEEMEGVLRENDHKHPIATHRLFRKMVDEIFELDREMSKGNTQFMSCVPKVIAKQVIKEAVDVANFAMMIANKYRLATVKEVNHV